MTGCDTLEHARDLTLRLWEHIATTPNHNTVKSAEEFKRDVLRAMDVPRLIESCPFCEYIFRAADRQCSECPIQHLCGYEYMNWADEIRTRGYHNHVLARKFYDALVDLFAVETSV